MNVSWIRNINALAEDASRKLHKGKITLSEYNEIMQGVNDLLKDFKVETISSKVSDHFKVFGFHVVERGVGWIITNY